MWNRAELKNNAKKVLRKAYWTAFLVLLVAAVLGGGIHGPSFSGSGYRADNGDWHWAANRLHIDTGAIEANGAAVAAIIGAVLVVVAIVLAIAAVAVAIGVAYRLFIGGPLTVGTARYFLEARQDRSDFTNLFYSFRAGRYMNAVKAMAWRLLFTFLWTLLFIVPGIVKGYAYSMVPYIVAENPGMDYKRALRLSMEMTAGEKWRIFVLDLSFIGWGLLAVLTCCIGFLFLSPYIAATKAELYAELRRKAVEKGLCAAGELGQPVA